MTTRPYSELVELVEAFAGASLGTQERNRLKALANRRAKKAYRATNYWPRFLKVGEEREVTSEGSLAFEQTGLDTIDTVLRIHASRPFYQQWAREYEFFVQNDGAQIINYIPADGDGIASITVTGSSEDYFNDTYYKTGELNSKPFFSAGNVPPETHVGTGIAAIYFSLTEGWLIRSYQIYPPSTWWIGTATGDDPSDGEWSAEAGGMTGPLVLTTTPTKSAFVTYKSALSATYGDGTTDESEVPEEWFDYMAYGAYADWLRGEGQTEKALVEDAAAKDVLDDQLEKISSQHIASQVAQRITTHANAQTRY